MNASRCLNTSTTLHTESQIKSYKILTTPGPLWEYNVSCRRTEASHWVFVVIDVWYNAKWRRVMIAIGEFWLLLLNSERKIWQSAVTTFFFFCTLLVGCIYWWWIVDARIGSVWLRLLSTHFLLAGCILYVNGVCTLMTVVVDRMGTVPVFNLVIVEVQREYFIMCSTYYGFGRDGSGNRSIDRS